MVKTRARARGFSRIFFETGKCSGGANNASVLLGNGDGTFKQRRDFAAGDSPISLALGDMNGDGLLDIVTTNYYEQAAASVLLGNGDGSFGPRAAFDANEAGKAVVLGDLNRDGVLDIVTAGEAQTVSVLIAQTRDGVSPLLDISLKTKTDAKWALELMKQKLTQLSQQRGIIGANQSRLSTAAANLQVERENYHAASSQIIDVDAASESSQLLKTQILQQAASSVLAQANQAPALALSLLQRS